MFKINPNDDVTVVGVSELRAQIYEVLQKVKREKVLLTRRNKPEAVIMGFAQFMEFQKELENLEDHFFGEIALQRLEEHKRRGGKRISHEEMIRKYGV